MKQIRCLLLLLPMLILITSAFAQNKEITGKVIDQSTGLPLNGVSILSDNNKVGVKTKEDGTFSISVGTATKSLVFSFIGYASQNIPVEGKTNINVSMVTEATEQAEVVVIGYGTQKKSNVTGAVSKYKNEKMDQSPVSRLDQALQGRIAGVQVQNISSEAGAAPKISIRGISSVNAGASPLIVIDGQPIPDGLGYINLADVESVEVLKDAASAAIYGSRGASGVILVTTKSGKSEKPKYNFRYSIGRKEDYKRYDIMTTTEYTNLLFSEAAYKATDPSITPPTGTAIASNAERAAYIIETTMMGGEGTDWQKESLRPGMFQNLQLSASGGKKDTRYFISGGYQRDEGMMYKSDFEKFNLRTKMNVDLSNRVKISMNLNPSYTRRESPSENLTNFYRYPSFIPVYHNALTAANVNQIPQWANIRPGDFAQPRHFSAIAYSGTMPDGSTWGPTVADPFSSAQNTPKSSTLNQDNKSNEYRLQAAGDISVNIIPGLDFKSLASVYVNYTTALNWANRNATADGVVNKGVYINNTYMDLLSENTLTYTKKFKEHSFDVLFGFTAQKTNINKDQTTGLDYPSDNIRTLNNATSIDKAGTFGTKNSIGLISYLGRINYSFKSRYLLSASFRADGSSYFGPGNKWGNFPSVSVGWIASEEDFLKNASWLNRLKFRASYGVSGNNRILDFGFLDLLNSANYSFGSNTGTITSGQVTSSTIIGNKDITWESTFQTNFGMDLSIIKNKINLSVDVYKSKTDKLLLQQSSMAFTGVPQFWNNIGSLENKGFELELSTTNFASKNFKWTTSANFSRTRNKILELGKEAYLLNQGERTEVYQNKVGDPLIQFYGFKTDGVWLSQADIDAARARGLTSSLANVFIAGGLKIVDVDGNNIIDNNDRTIIGNPYPDFTWGITNNLSYKGFDLSFMFQGVKGGSLINGDANYNESRRMLRVFNNNRWLSPKFPGDGKTPYSTIGFNWMLTDYVVEDASYFALRDINFGYTLPESAVKFLKMTSLRVYFAAQNLYFNMAKGYRALNPEGRSNGGAYASTLIDGYQRGSFPIPKSFVFGVDINF
ncbi:MAG: TonB-dependent receptor [Bacteroidetes bacterium]|nr:MAG: TonB-dependent receptor [Bacteroidota bacterium]